MSCRPTRIAGFSEAIGFSISMIGGWEIDGSVAQRLLSQAVRQQVQAQHQGAAIWASDTILRPASGRGVSSMAVLGGSTPGASSA